MVNIFVYGTLMFPEIREIVGGRAFSTEPATVEGFCVFRVKNATFPGLLRTPGSVAEGQILKEISEKELARFDAYEDCFYVRSTVHAKSESGEIIECEVYEVPENIAGEILSSDRWTVDWFEQHRTEYIRRLSENS